MAKLTRIGIVSGVIAVVLMIMLWMISPGNLTSTLLLACMFGVVVFIVLAVLNTFSFFNKNEKS